MPIDSKETIQTRCERKTHIFTRLTEVGIRLLRAEGAVMPEQWEIVTREITEMITDLVVAREVAAEALVAERKAAAGAKARVDVDICAIETRYAVRDEAEEEEPPDGAPFVCECAALQEDDIPDHFARAREAKAALRRKRDAVRRWNRKRLNRLRANEGNCRQHGSSG